MDARAKTVREILHSGDQYIIPLFQRHYSWTKKHWDRLWADIRAIEDAEAKSQHFLGPLVCTPAQSIPGEVPAFQLIDGQQRLTTLSILLAALRDVARERGFISLADEIYEDYLVHKRKKGTDRYKVLPRLDDRRPLHAVIEGKVERDLMGREVVKAWRYFYRLVNTIEGPDAEQRLSALFSTVRNKLSLVVITIDGENPYEIFESLNSTGLPLEESDLIRNFVFMQVPLQDQDAFNDEYWRGFEKVYANGKLEPLPPTTFYRNYLMREGAYSRRRVTFVDFKDQYRRGEKTAVAQVEELKRFARIEVQLRSPKNCQDVGLRSRLEQIAQLDITTAYPLLMNLLSRHEAGSLSREELLDCLADLASFVLRRSICGDSTRAYGRWFTEAIKTLQDQPKDNLRAYWLHRGWPDDATFKARVGEFALYLREPKKCRLILEELERSVGHKEQVELAKLTIEHVMPQKISSGTKGKDWQAALGVDWSAQHKRWVHTLGNLTLTGYNTELSNRPFSDKCVELNKSNVSLNKFFNDIDHWDIDAIRSRGEAMARQVAELWPRPDGGAYVPPIADVARTMSAEQRRQACVAFWQALLEEPLLGDIFGKLPKPWDKRSLHFKFETVGVALAVRLQPKKRVVEIVLRLYGSKYKERFDLLLNEKSAVEQDVGASLQWVPARKRKSNHVVLSRANTNAFAEHARPELTKWVAEHLAKLHSVASERLSLDKDDGAPLSERRQTQLEYWRGVNDLLSAHNGDVRARKPRPQHWMSFGLGVAHYGMHAALKAKDRWIRVGVTCHGKDAKGDFRKLRAMRGDIETELGDQLEWEELPHRKESRISLKQVDADPLDRDDWPRQHEWLVEKLEAMRRVFAPRLRLLNKSDS